MNLSAHFTLEEMIASETAARLGIDNSPNALQMERLRYTAAALEFVRARTGALHVNSGFRCPRLNEAVGSKPTSQHVLGEAADVISLAGVTPLGLCRLIAKSSIPFDQIIWEFGAWMHISFVSDREPRRSMLTIDKQGTREGF